MSYTKQNFSQGQVLTAEALNAMDEQIKENSDNLANFTEALNQMDEQIKENLDNLATKLYKHNVMIHSGDYAYDNEATTFVAYISSSSTPIRTLDELISSPAVAGSNLMFVSCMYWLMDSDGGWRDVYRIIVSSKDIRIYYIDSYTVPVHTTIVTHKNTGNIFEITDTVTEV